MGDEKIDKCARLVGDIDRYRELVEELDKMVPVKHRERLFAILDEMIDVICGLYDNA
jgi:DNA polymerase/3'-5' exonuclease PolX